jgi:hypothetical protein
MYSLLANYIGPTVTVTCNGFQKMGTILSQEDRSVQISVDESGEQRFDQLSDGKWYRYVGRIVSYYHWGLPLDSYCTYANGMNERHHDGTWTLTIN